MLSLVEIGETSTARYHDKIDIADEHLHVLSSGRSKDELAMLKGYDRDVEIYFCAHRHLITNGETGKRQDTPHQSVIDDPGLVRVDESILYSGRVHIFNVLERPMNIYIIGYLHCNIDHQTGNSAGYSFPYGKSSSVIYLKAP